MVFPVRVMITETKPPDVTVRAFRTIQREAHQSAGRHWHSQVLPRHFEPQAHYRYKHKPRSAAWRKRKLRLARDGQAERGGRVDNVFTGTLEQMVRSWAQVRAFPTRATVTMNGPRYVTMKPRSTTRPHIARELTTVTPDEADTMAGIAESQVARGINEFRQTRSSEVKS